MSLTVIHTADLHLGRAFKRSISPNSGRWADAAAALREARYGALDTLADLARANGAQHILVAGDVFHAQDVGRDVIARALAHMTADKSLTWHLLPGNHDWLQPGGVWSSVIAQLDDSDPVMVHAQAAPHEIAPGYVLLPCPSTVQFETHDPTAWLAETAHDTQTSRIGLAHGAVTDFDQGSGRRAIIATDCAERTGLAYMALGDWHGSKSVSKRCWYAGTPEEENWKKNDAGNALVVRFNGREPSVAVERTGKFTWMQLAVDCRHGDSAPTLADEISDQSNARPTDLLLSLKLTGTLSSDHHAALTAEIEGLSNRLRYIRVDDSGLRIDAGANAKALIDGDEVLAEVAARLSAISAGDDDRAPIADHALRALTGLAQALPDEAATQGDTHASVSECGP